MPSAKSLPVRLEWLIPRKERKAEAKAGAGGSNKLEGGSNDQGAVDGVRMDSEATGGHSHQMSSKTMLWASAKFPGRDDEVGGGGETRGPSRGMRRQSHETGGNEMGG
jgi:hypothetical protein